MAEFDSMQNSQNSPMINQRTTMTNDMSGAVPPPPAYPSQNSAVGSNSAGLLRTKISLGAGRKPAVVMPFLLMKPELPAPSPYNGSMNLLTFCGLDHAWNKFCAPNKKLKDELSAFLPHLPGNIDMPGSQDNSSLRSLIDKPPICGKEILPLSASALAGFKLQPGPIPDNYRVFAGTYAPSRSAPNAPAASTTEEKGGHHSRKKHKRKHERSSRGSEDRPPEGVLRDEKAFGHGVAASSSVSRVGLGHDGASSSAVVTSNVPDEGRKSKTDDAGTSEKKKKKKKDKKRKRSRSPEHSSGHPSSLQSNNPPSASAYSTDFVDF